MDHLFAGALRVNVALEILKRPAQEARTLLILIFSSDNVSGDGEPWIVTRPLSRMGHGSFFRETAARLVREGVIDREGTTINVYASRLVAPATVAQATGSVGIATPIVAPPTGVVAPATGCIKDARALRGQRKQRTEDCTPPPAPRKPRKKAAKKPPDPREARLIDVWHRLFLEATGQKYPFGGVDRRKIREMLEDLREGDIANRMRTCWQGRIPKFVFSDGTFPDLKVFASVVKKIVPGSNGSTHPSMNSETWTETEVPR